jgi:RNA-directed DNA polymerase
MLMDVQRWILANVLGHLSGHPASFAYQPDLSIVDCANQHRGARWLVKLDLHNFFDAVTESLVYRTFRRLGYDKLMAFELARVTTRAENAEFAPQAARGFVIQEYVVTQQGRLPQGAPTSGQLANAAAARLDRLLSAYASKHDLTYTRYSDDLMFSGGEDFQRGQAVAHTHALGGLIHAAGFTPHRSKTRIVPPGARHVILGLLVDDDVRLLPEHARRIENHLRGCEKFGLAKHAAHRGFDSVFSFANHLDGWIAFAMGVERARAIDWRGRLFGIMSDAGIPVQPSA